MTKSRVVEMKIIPSPGDAKDAVKPGLGVFPTKVKVLSGDWLASPSGPGERKRACRKQKGHRDAKGLVNLRWKRFHHFLFLASVGMWG